MASMYNVAATLTVHNKGFITGFAAATSAVGKFNTALHTASASNAAYQRSMAASNAAMGASLAAVGTQATRMKNETQKATQGMRTMQAASTGMVAGMTAAGNSASDSSKKVGLMARGTDLAARDLDRFNRTARGFSMTAIGLGAISLATVIGSFKEFASYESAFANFKKVTEANTEEFREFDLVFRELARNIPATYEEISNTAAMASQLGVAKEDVAEFTETMIRMGTSTTMSSEEAATTLSRFMNVMDTAGGDVDRLGSTIVQLGNNYAATETEIMNMALRISGMGSALGMAETDVLALSTTLTSLGVRAEMGGSAISTIMSKTASEISRGTEVGQAWADVMGMSIEEVATLMEEDAYGALIKMVEGLEDVDESGGNLDQTLRDLGINEIRQLDVMKRLVGSSGDLAEAQKMANGEWEANNALVEESAARYETLESKMQIIKNSIDNIFSNMGNAFAQSSEGILSKITDIIQEVDRMTDSFFDSNGVITETGEKFVDTATKIAGITTVLGLAGVAFMAFGTGGAVAVAVTAGLGAIGIAVVDLLDQFGLIPESLGGDDVESAIRLIERSSDEATAEAATNYVRLKDEALQALGDLATESGEEAAKSREKIVEQFEQMSQEVVEAIEGDRQALNTAIAGLMEGATEPERQALEKAKQNIEKHYDEQLKLARNYTETVEDVMNNHITETGAITDEGMQKFNAAAQGMDQLFGTAIAKSQGEMSKFKSAFDRAFDERDVKKAQENLTGMANSTVDSITELNKAYEEQKNAIEATDAPLKDKELILQGLERQYDESKLALLDNLAAMESEAKQNGLNVSAIEDLSDAQLEKLGITRDEYAQLLLTSGALKDNADENHNLSTALDAAKDAASRSSEEYAKLVEEFNKFDIGASTVKEALTEIRNVTEEEALEIGKLFAVNLADGTQEVDMGTYGTMSVEDFVQGVRSEDITSKEAGIALSNAFRDGLGQEPLTETGQKQVEEYVAGMSSSEASVEEVAKMLGYATADGVQVNLEGEAAMNIETFVAGLKKGEFGVFEVIRIMTDNMEGILTKDFSQFGEEDMATFAAGLESGLISTEAATELITNSLDENMLVDLGPQGEQSVGSWIDMFTNGDIKVQEFVSGLEAFLGEETYFDLSEPGTSTAESYATAFGTGMDATTQVMMDYGPKLKESAKVDLSEEGGNVAGSFANGIAGRMEEIRQKASEVKSTTENTVGSTTDGGGGQKAASDFMLGFINLAPSIASWVTGTKTDTETTLGSTTDGGGGASAIGAFASGLLTNSGTAETNASSVSTSVENTLSNTSDGSGGLNATGAFASGILANLVLAQSAANNASGAVQNALSTTTDGGGGANAGAAFSSGVLGSIAAATGAANSAKLGVQGTLGTTTDGGGGFRAGSIFSGGLASTIGAVTGSANSAKNSVQTTLGSTTDSSGGQKAGSMFAGGIRSQFGAVQSAANTNKTNVERTLGSTTDNRGGNRAGTMFVSGIRSQIGAATSAANSNKSNVESTLGSTTDNGGGNRAGNMFVSGVKSHTGAASGAGNQVSSSARSGLSNNSNTFSLGADFGSGFVRGIASYVGAAARAAANLVASALSAIKRRQNSASPSKETMKLGDDFGDGFALAIVDKTREAVSAARNMARDAINAAGDESVKNALAVDVGGFNGSMNAVNSRVTHELESKGSDDRRIASVHIHQHGDIEWLRTEIDERNGVDARVRYDF